MSISVNDFLRLALSEIRVARAGDVPSPDDMGDALLIFNELLDALNVDHRAIYTRMIGTFTFTPNLQPHTIGLAANNPTFVVTVGRPTRILDANVLLATNVRQDVAIRDEEWWSDLSVPAVTAAFPTDLNYVPDWPNGTIRFWPVPTTAYNIELQLETLFVQVALADTMDLPFGYQQALRLTTAELLAPAFGQQLSPSTEKKARQAREVVWGNNDTIPNARTRDGGMPGGRGGGFNFRTGMMQ